MAKNFLEVFPTLNIAESLKELLGLAQVEKVTTTRDRSSIRIYLKSARLIHKQNIYDLERGIRDQLFPDKQVAIKIQEKYRLSDQYTPKKLLDVYKDSLLLELKNYSIIEYTMFRKAGITFEKVFLSDELKAWKGGPDRRFFSEVCRELKVKPEEILHIGDSVSDISGASKSGLHSCLISRDYRPYKGKAQPDYRINGLSEIAKLLRKIPEKGLAEADNL